MKRKNIGNNISSFGLGVIVSSIVYPLGNMDTQTVFYGMLVIGTVLVLTGMFIYKTNAKIEPNIKSQ